MYVGTRLGFQPFCEPAFLETTRLTKSSLCRPCRHRLAYCWRAGNLNLSSYAYAYAYVQWGHRWHKHEVIADRLIVLSLCLCLCLWQHVLTGHRSDISISILPVKQTRYHFSPYSASCRDNWRRYFHHSSFNLLSGHLAPFQQVLIALCSQFNRQSGEFWDLVLTSFNPTAIASYELEKVIDRPKQTPLNGFMVAERKPLMWFLSIALHIPTRLYCVFCVISARKWALGCKLWPQLYERPTSTSSFNLCDFLTNFIWYCSIYAGHSLPVKFFPKYYFNKLCFELPQN